MTDNEKKILEDFIHYNENQTSKYIVIDKAFLTAENYSFGTCEFIVTIPPQGSAIYEFNGNSVIGKVMDLYKQLEEGK